MNYPNLARELVRRELEMRLKKNSHLSARRIAQMAGLSPSRLSEFLNGHSGISLRNTVKIADVLNLEPRKRDYFIHLSQCAFSKSDVVRARARKELKKMKIKPQTKFEVLKEDAFIALADWHHVVLLELIKARQKVPVSKSLARRLNITESELNLSLLRLKRLGLIDLSDSIAISKDKSIQTSDDIPSPSIRKFHEQYLVQARRAMDRAHVKDREFQSLILSCSDSDMPEAKKMIRDFVDTFQKQFVNHDLKSSVYNLGIQFFEALSTEEKI